MQIRKVLEEIKKFWDNILTPSSIFGNVITAAIIMRIIDHEDFNCEDFSEPLNLRYNVNKVKFDLEDEIEEVSAICRQREDDCGKIMATRFGLGHPGILIKLKKGDLFILDREGQAIK